MELAIDSVGEHASVAISDEGRPVAEITWPSGRRHTPSLVPAIDEVCRLAGRERAEITALFVDVGPGAYSGIRAGMAAAIGVALALGAPVVGVGRLEVEAYAHAAAAAAVAAVHRARRGQWALAVYRGPPCRWREEQPPHLLDEAPLIDALHGIGEGGVLCGEVDALAESVRARLCEAGLTIAGPAAAQRRAGLLAELGWRRLRAGGAFGPGDLEPLYLREPAIGPQPPAEAGA